ncbi:MAG TPA: DUF2283 domain-containing protein [bacterium]|nr:DUF2283 domain-containing protein [bacterium]
MNLFKDKNQPLDWDYDDEADTLYLSFGPPRPALGIDAGDGVILRYDEKARELVGLTIVGVGGRLKEYLKRSA